MAARPGTSRGRQEQVASATGATRPLTRGKGYLDQPAAMSPERPTSRHGPAPQQHASTITAAETQHTRTSTTLDVDSLTNKQRPTTLQSSKAAKQFHLQEQPSDVSISLSDLEAMSSSISVGAAHADITTGQASRRASQQQEAGLTDRRHLQTPAAEVWQLSRQKQQKKKGPAAAGVHAVTLPAAPVAESSATSTASELSGYSSSFLSFQGSSVEIVYSEASVAHPVHPPQLQQQTGPVSKGPIASQEAATTIRKPDYAAVTGSASQPAAGTTGPAVTGRLKASDTSSAAVSAEEQPAAMGNRISLTADSSILSAEIEFSSASIGATATAADHEASAAGTEVKTVHAPAFAAVQQPIKNTATTRATTPATGGRRTAEVNLRWSEDAIPSNRDETTGVLHPLQSASQLTADNRNTKAPGAASADTHTTMQQAQDAAAATDALFASLTAVQPARGDTSSEYDSVVETDNKSEQSSGSRHSSRRSRRLVGRSADEVIPANYVPNSSGGSVRSQLCTASNSEELTDDVTDMQQLPIEALDVLAGLEALHGTLQAVQQNSYSSAEDHQQSASGCSSRKLSASNSQQHLQRAEVERRTCNSALAQTPQQEQKAGTAALQDLSALAAEAAAETEALLGSLKVVQQQNSYPSVSTNTPTLSREALDIQQQRQQRQKATSNSNSGRLFNRQSSTSLHSSAACDKSKEKSVDINELITRQQGAALDGSQQMQATGRKRSIALQVGSSNDKCTQVMFDQQRQLLWDGGNLRQQHQNLAASNLCSMPRASSLSRGSAMLQNMSQGRRSCGRESITSCNPLTSTACNNIRGGVVEHGIGRTSSWLSSGGHSGLGARMYGTGHGSCWSVLSASLQQFRAAALLDQLEGLLKMATTATQQQQQQQQHGPVAQSRPTSVSAAAAAAVTAVVHQCQEKVPLRKQQQREATEQSASVATGDTVTPCMHSGANGIQTAEWCVLPSSAPVSSQMDASKAQHLQELPQPATQTANSQLNHQSAQRHQAADSSNSQIPARGWMALPSADIGSVTSSPLQSGGKAAAVHDRLTPTAGAGSAAASDGWFSLPVLNNRPVQHALALESVQEQSKPEPIAPVDATPTAATAGTAVMSAAPVPGQETGWFSLPMPGTTVVASQAAAAAAVEPCVEPAGCTETPPGNSTPATDVWFQLPTAIPAADHLHTQLQAQLDGNQNVCCGLQAEQMSQQPVAGTREADAGTTSTLAASITRLVMPAAGMDHKSHASQAYGQQQPAYELIAASQRSDVPLASAASAAAQYSSDFEAARDEQQARLNTASAVVTCACKPVPAAGAAWWSSADVCGSTCNDPSELQRDEAHLQTACESQDDISVMSSTPQPTAAEAKNTCRTFVGDQQQQQDMPVEQLDQADNSSNSTDTMLRYLSYLDSMMAQGIAPPGLTLTTARNLRDTLLQTITASQQQHSPAGYGYLASLSGSRHGLASIGARPGALCCEDLVTSCCLDSFMSSSLTHVRSKLNRGGAISSSPASWCSEGVQWHRHPSYAAAAVPAEQHVSDSMASQGPTAGPDHAGQIRRQLRSTYGSADAGRRSPLEVTWADRSYRREFRYTTLEDTLSYIRQHRSKAAVR